MIPSLNTALDELRKLSAGAAGHARDLALPEIAREWVTQDGAVQSRNPAQRRSHRQTKTLRQFARAVQAVETECDRAARSQFSSPAAPSCGHSMRRAFLALGSIIIPALDRAAPLRRRPPHHLSTVGGRRGDHGADGPVGHEAQFSPTSFALLPFAARRRRLPSRSTNIMAWRAGQTDLLQSSLTRARDVQRAHDPPTALRQLCGYRATPGHFQHGQV